MLCITPSQSVFRCLVSCRLVSYQSPDRHAPGKTVCSGIKLCRDLQQIDRLMVDYLGTDTTGTEMKYGQESRLRGRLKSNLRVPCLYGSVEQACEFMLVISRCTGQLARQNAGDNGGKYRMGGQCTRRPRQEEPKTKDGSSQIQYNPVECASPQSATCR
jgi:hypothetical protein